MLTTPGHGIPGPELLTTKQAATILGLSTRTVQRMIQNGDLETVLLGRARRIRYHAVRVIADGRDTT